jgi:tRNA threonylcarbamoyladenosine biosynthesis protein TsaB
MIILAMRTDKPEAEVYVFDNGKKLAEVKWQAHLKLAETLNAKIKEILDLLSISYEDLSGVAIFKGPGSFTGLRIGMSVANAIAYAQAIPIIARDGDDWLHDSLTDLQADKSDKVATPEYGAPAHTTQPRK